MEQKKVTRDFKVLTEKISPDNVAVMAELIAMKETKILISYLENEITELEERLIRYRVPMTLYETSRSISKRRNLPARCATN